MFILISNYKLLLTLSYDDDDDDDDDDDEKNAVFLSLLCKTDDHDDVWIEKDRMHTTYISDKKVTIYRHRSNM